MSKINYPFSAVVGQDEAKLAIILNLIDPNIGGVLLSGEKGTAKSTLIRSVNGLLDNRLLFTIPLNATEEALVGGLDLEKAMVSGELSYDPGLLYKANNQLLYIDEINLLSESISNIILDASVMKRCHIEREGFSKVFESNFILLGSMNPEEGQLKPQILDRFGFYVHIKGSDDLNERVEVIKRRLQYENNSKEFSLAYKNEDEILKRQIIHAKEKLGSIVVSEKLLKEISKLNHKLKVQGHRGDIVLALAAKAHAAFHNRLYVTVKDVEAVLELTVIHRQRDHQSITDWIENKDLKEELKSYESDADRDSDGSSQEVGDHFSNESKDIMKSEEAQLEEYELQGHEIDESFFTKDIFKALEKKVKMPESNGRRNKSRSHNKKGRYIKYKLPKGRVNDIAFDATLRQAAPHQKFREKNGLMVSIARGDIREKIRENRIGNTILFVVDGSGSMGINRRMSTVKGAIFGLLQEAYQKRDTVGLMTFRQNQVEMVLPPTRSIDLAHKKLQNIETGGKTPLIHAIQKSVEYVMGLKAKDKYVLPIVVIITDGRDNMSKEKNINEAIETLDVIQQKTKIDFIVVDSETGFLKFGLAKKIAEQLKAVYLELEDLKEEDLVKAIKDLA